MTRFVHRSLSGGCALLAIGFVSYSARGDISVLGITGPHSGTGFSNLGTVSRSPIATTLTNAEVVIEIQGKTGDDLIATCTAVFDLDTDAGPPQTAQTLLVAFPMTGFTDEAVNISQFEVVVNGIHVPELARRQIRLFSEENGPNLYEELESIKANPIGFETLGRRLYSSSVSDTMMLAYAWSQEFEAGKHARVEIKYSLTLHPQSLAYAKKVQHSHSWNVVPFDAMWAGESSQKAYFLDYILRSGATWKGPIGHEKVTLKVAPTSEITVDLDAGFDSGVITFGRHLFENPEPLLRESLERSRAGVLPEGFHRATGLVWEINREEPQEDILVEIPWHAVKNKVKSKTDGR